MKSARAFPRVIREGSVSVKVYRNRHPRTASGWIYQVAWIPVGGGRKLVQFADEAAAMEEARLRATQLASGRIEAADLTRSDRDELVAARRMCGGVPLLAAVAEWCKARELTGGNLLGAAESWAERVGNKLEQVSLERAVELFSAAKRRSGVDFKASYKRILPTLVGAMGARSLHSISSRELNAWLEARYPHPVTRNTARKRIVTLWRWARKQGYLPRDVMTEAEQTDSAQEPHAAIAVIDVRAFSALLQRIRKDHPEYLAALVIAGFCGLRRAEVHQQQWEHIELSRKFVRVSAAKRNTPARRLVPLSDAAVEWLQLCESKKGAICSNLAIDRIRDIGRTAGFELPDNCFRHSFISHRVAQTGNVAETALEAGNSPQVIFQHYRELFTKEDGEAWFSLRPGE